MLLSEQQQEAFRELAAGIDGIDRKLYRELGHDPLDPIIGLGPPNARIGFLGRDPGREEVRHGEPFIGAGGQLVRRTVYRYLYAQDLPDFEASRELGRLLFWINTVPYKPVGNKAWSMTIKRRFRPLMTNLLIEQWQGRALITMGREAFLWFAIDQAKSERDRIHAFWRREDRFESSINIERAASDDSARQCFTLYPLPHPSPLNATWHARFPGLLRNRLAQLDARPETLLDE